MILSQASQYAICGLARLAASDAGYRRVTDLVRGTSAPADAVAKVFQQLAKRGLVRSRRGAKGGFRLNESSRHVTLMEVIEAVEGNWRGSVEESGFCSPTEPCPLSLLLRPVHRDLERLLRTTRVGDLVTASSGAGVEQKSVQPSCGEQT
jgi:Rrf2 family transcriptional regulator, iron-sulfur cluster assembly transcription factor